MNKPLSILLCGKSCMVESHEYKGYNGFSAVRYYEPARRMERLFTSLGHQFTHIPCHLIHRQFPRTLQELQRYDVVFLCDVGGDNFLLLPEMVEDGVRCPNLPRLLRDYAAAGGGVGMIGGYMSFTGRDGKGRWGETGLAEALPVTMLPYDDRVELPEGADLIYEGGDGILGGMPREWPYVLGYNRVSAKKDAQVLLSYQGDPIITVGTFGTGRTLAYATDCTPHWAPAAMNEWAYYPLLWDKLAHWLAQK